MCRNINILLIMLLLPFLSFAEKPPEGEGWEYYSKTKNSVQGTEIKLLPSFDQAAAVLQDLYDQDPAMSIELHFTMPLPETGGEDIMDFLFSKLQAISTMEGIEYYSANNDAMTLYLERCFLVEQKGRQKQVPDPVFVTPPAFWQATVFQEDTTFGKNWYDLQMTVSRDAIRMRLKNVTTMRYFFFPIMGEGGVVIELIIIPGEETLQFYALSQLETSVRQVLGKKIYLPGVFDHRVSAYQSWLAKRIYSDPRPGIIQP
jgi:hypothetical protein